mgnify:CR=1 FL=1
MKRLLPALLLCSLAANLRAEEGDAKEPAAEAAGVSFDGIWKPKGAMLGGTLLPPPALKAITLTIADDKYEVSIEGEEHSDRGFFVLDETVTPKRMVIKSTAGPNEGKIFLAIYESTGETSMRVCYDLSGKAFPTEFKAPQDSELYLVGYHRQKAAEKQHRPAPQ